jgi:hypothetical protein
MKPLLIVILIAAIGASGMSYAQNKIQAHTKNGVTTITIHCDSRESKESCERLLSQLPQPPQPPTPPGVPEPVSPPTPPAAATLPEPPAPPPVPKIVIPAEVRAACDSKAVGDQVTWNKVKDEIYAGTCVKKNGKMMFDVDYISIKHN